MAEYINKEPFLDKLLYMGYFDDNDEIKDIADKFTTKDVIERFEYNELHEKYLKAIHDHTGCLKQLHEYRSKIDKAIEELQQCKVYGHTDCARLVSLPEVLNIIKRNIGVLC